MGIPLASRLVFLLALVFPLAAASEVMFATFAGGARQQLEAAALCGSLRKNGGAWREAPCRVYSSQEVSVPPAARGVPFAEKVSAAAEAEKHAEGKFGVLVWLDSDTLLLREPRELILREDVAFAYRPVHHRLIGSALSEPPDTFWRLLYDRLKVPAQAVFPVHTHLDREPIRAYFNAGLLAVRPEKKILRRWRECFERMCADREIRGECESDPRRLLYLHQAVLAGAVLSAIGKPGMLELPDTYNTPLGLVSKPEVLDGLATVRTEGLPRKLVDRHIAASGGRAAADRISTEYRRGLMRVGPHDMWSVESHADASGRWQMRIAVAETTMIEYIWDRTESWVNTPEGTRDLPVEARGDFDAILSLRAMLRPAEHFPVLAVRGLEREDGRQVWVLDAAPHDGKPIPARFDAATGLLTGLGDSRFENYQPVSGVLAPFRLRVLGKQVEQVIDWAEVRRNVDLSEARFDKTASAAALREESGRMTAESLARHLAGIDAGPAREVLGRMHTFAPEDGRILYDLIVARGYRRGLEIGTSTGNSAIWMGIAFQKNGGRLVTIEKDAGRAKTAKENFRGAGLADVIEVRIADALEEIPRLAGEIDFVFMDTGTSLHKKFLDLVFSKVTPGGAIASHNANQFEQQQPDFLKAITSDPNLETRLVFTAGGGISLSAKRR